MYGTELDKSEDHAELKPVIAVWICETDLFPSSKQSHLRFQMREEREGFLLHGDAQIDVLQLRRWWSARKDILASSVGAWFWFFNEAKDWTEVPAEIDSPTMEQAMEILHDFRKDTFLNDLYRKREEAQRIERGAQKALERAERGEAEERRQKEAALLAKEAEREAKEAALLAKEAALVAKEAALAEAERLRSLLLAAGIRLPDAD